VTIVYALRIDPVWPSFRDLALAAIGTLAMYLALLPLRSLSPGAATLLSQIVVGVVVYGIFVALFDIAHLRRSVVEWLGRTFSRA